MTQPSPQAVQNRQAAAGSAVGGVLAAILALTVPVAARWEGFAPRPYLDLVKKQTWCFGETVDTGTVDGKPKALYSRAECEAMLQRSLVTYAKPVMACLPARAPLELKAAFTSFAYNVGSKAACASKAAQAARAGDYARACVALGNWVWAGGRKVQGLVNRRKAETQLCLRGVEGKA